MNILIPDSWLKDYLTTNATPKEFAMAMSLTSVSIERMEKVGDDTVYDIEVTTNRPDLMSIAGIAREASAVLPEQGFDATFKTHKYSSEPVTSKSPLLHIQSDPSLVNRILAVVAEVKLANSPKEMSDRLEKTGIRSLNNVIDVTNYIMREIGHPAHVFDYDRLVGQTLIIRRSKKGEQIVTLDDKVHTLPGNDIVADNGSGEIIDLLGIMGTANSVVTDHTKRIVLFLDNNNAQMLRKTSMNLGIRTEAAIVNEKGLDPELMMPTLLRGIELLKQNANAKIISPIIDIYPNKPQSKSVSVSKEKIDSLIGVDIPISTVSTILKSLGFGVHIEKSVVSVAIPTIRNNDIEIEEDIIEEIARVYGYHKIPNVLPQNDEQNFYHQDENEFYWIRKIKEAFLYWGFNETYTYSLVAEEQFDGPIENAIKLKNPLTEDRMYLRNTLTSSLLSVIQENKTRNTVKIFEIANVYIKKADLPSETLHISGVIKKDLVSFYEGKGIIEQLFKVLGIIQYSFKKRDEGLGGTSIYIDNKQIGILEEDELISFELNLSEILSHVSSKKVYKVPPKFPPVIEDVRLEIDSKYSFIEITQAIKNASKLIKDVSLLDVYGEKKTFRLTYINPDKNLKNEDVIPEREAVYKMLSDKFHAKIG